MALDLSILPLLVQRAKQNNWCVTEDHCLLRIIYDYACKDNWRNHIKPPAYKNMNKEQLIRAEEVIYRLLTGTPKEVALLNYASLKWRKKV